ncbi:hypothetical protein ACWGNM_30605 [Streptomyces sp. NPDC055796]
MSNAPGPHHHRYGQPARTVGFGKRRRIVEKSKSGIAAGSVSASVERTEEITETVVVAVDVEDEE